MLTNCNGDTYITVIPFCSHCKKNFRREIIVHKLCFWFNESFDHRVNDESIREFLSNVKMFGASIYPDYPELGCFAINRNEIFSPAGKTGVGEIYYKGEVIYCRI